MTSSNLDAGTGTDAGGHKCNGYGLNAINNLSELKDPTPRKLDRLFCLVHATPVFRSDLSAQMPVRETERERETEQSIDDEVIPALIPRMTNYLDEFVSSPIDIMMPLSDPCMRELVKSIYPSPECDQILSRDILQLLPNRARSRGFDLDPQGSEASEGQGQGQGQTCVKEMEMECKYLMISESDLLPLSFKDGSGKMNKNSENDGCEAFYCIQLSDRNILSDEKRIGLTYSNMSEEKLLQHLLADRTSMSAYIHPDKISVSSVLEDSNFRPCSSCSLDMQCTQPPSPSQVPPTKLKKHADKESIIAERGDYWYKLGAEEPATTAIGSERDASVLSTMCYWRSCQSEASSSSCNLCAYHSDLKSFLDREALTNLSSAPSDALKYLPCKVPAMSLQQGDERSRDSRIVRAASTLLQELGEGKLKFTVRSFIRKTVEEMRCKRRLEVAAASCRTLQLANESPEQLKCYSSLRQTCSARSSLTGARTRRLVEPDSIGPSLTQPTVVIPSLPSSPMWAQWKDEDLLRR